MIVWNVTISNTKIQCIDKYVNKPIQFSCKSILILYIFIIIFFLVNVHLSTLMRFSGLLMLWRINWVCLGYNFSFMQFSLDTKESSSCNILSFAFLLFEQVFFFLFSFRWEFEHPHLLSEFLFLKAIIREFNFGLVKRNKTSKKR